MFDPGAASSVFPTRVGVNLACCSRASAAVGFPHTRGGEPFLLQHVQVACYVFPTRVGVNRACAAAGGELKGFSPHAWG